MVNVDGVEYYTLSEARAIIQQEELLSWQKFFRREHELKHAEGWLSDFGGKGCEECGLSWDEQNSLADSYGSFNADGKWVSMRKLRGY